MIESIFVFMSATALIFFILGIENKAIVYSALSTVLWIIIMGASLYIEVPAIDEGYTEYGFSAFCLAFIFANIIWMILQLMEFRKSSQYNR